MARIAVIGTGQIGASWAALLLAHGHDVTATDPAPGAEQRLRAAIETAWPALETLGLAPGADPSRVRFVPGVASAVADAEFVQESGPEVLSVKHELVRAIDAILDPAVIVASSTSGLLASDIQAPARHPERYLIGHPFNPPHLIPLVEVVGGLATAEAVVEGAVTFYRSLGRRPIRLQRELPGHVANRLQAAVWREAFSLVANGVVTVAELDEVMANGPGLRWALLGPFLNLHASGGPAGISHTLEHLDRPIREWVADLAEYPEGEDYIGVMAAGVEAELSGRDFSELLAARDAVLLRLLADKRQQGLST